MQHFQQTLAVAVMVRRDTSTLPGTTAQEIGVPPLEEDQGSLDIKH